MRRKLPVVLKYGLAVLSVAAALVLTLLLAGFMDTIPLLYAAVIIDSWYGGRGPGLLSVLLATMAVDYYFVPPIHTLAWGKATIPHLVTFALLALTVSFLSTARRRAEASLRQARDEMETKVLERTADLKQINKKLQAEIVERKRAEEGREQLLVREQAARAEAEAAQQRFRDLVNSVEGIVWEVDAGTFQFLFVSQQAERVLGYPIERWLSEPTFWRDHIHPDDREWTANSCLKATAEKRDCDFEYRMIAADGRIVRLRDLVTVVVEGNRVTRLRGVMLDITERKRAEEALQEAKAELAHVARVTTMGELTASIAHEINQPLATVVTNANACYRLLASESPDLEEVREAVADIAEAGMRAGEVISRIRALLKKGTPEKTPLDINQVIEEVLTLTRSELQRHGVLLRTELLAGLPLVLGDRVQLQQMILNLTLNGMEAMTSIRNGPRLLLIRSQVHHSRGVLVEVQDSGVGLDRGSIERLFDPFFTTKPNGMGMGLAICRTIIEAHGGHLWATPNNGQGATFQFTLPVDREAVA